MTTSNKFDASKSSHVVYPGNVYRMKNGDVVVVSFRWSIMSACCMQIHPVLKSRDIDPDLLRYRCQLIGKNYRLK